jgi:membrane-associated protease RseP (regulator of RpoE activity)
MPEPLPPFSSTYESARPAEILMVRRPRPRYWLHALLLLATAFTTLVVGAGLQFGFQHGLPPFSERVALFPVDWVLARPARLLLGVPFALPLLLILLAHEMGHYLYCVRYRVNATLPYFIPAPTLIGTLGAFIRIRGPIPTRTALFDIGIAGPIAGFIVAVFTLAMALLLSRPMPPGAAAGDIQFGYPLIFDVVHAGLNLFLGNGALPSMQQANLHPMGVAAWVGMFATALNLLPAGQLDGGHIVYACSPRAHRWVSLATVLVLIPLGALLWMGWLLWALLLNILGTRHPPVPAWPPLAPGRRALLLLAVLMLLLTFVPAPFHAPALAGD